MSGRFAPSPTGRLHLGNLRTALLAWAAARRCGLAFLIRMEDLDLVTSSRDHERDQLLDLSDLGLDWDGEVVRQSERFDLYQDALDRLTVEGRTFACYCTRREIAEATRAPHLEDADASRYPGTCRRLSARDRAERERGGRAPAIRLLADDTVIEFDDLVRGPTTGRPDDIVLRRNDGVPAYHLAVVSDDHRQGVTQIVRGDDLLGITPSQIHLGRLLGFSRPDYAHVPLVRGPHGERLAKRDGAVTLPERVATLGSVAAVIDELAASAGLGHGVRTAGEVAAAFSFDRLDRRSVRWTPTGDDRFVLRPDSPRTG